MWDPVAINNEIESVLIIPCADCYELSSGKSPKLCVTSAQILKYSLTCASAAKYRSQIRKGKNIEGKKEEIYKSLLKSIKLGPYLPFSIIVWRGLPCPPEVKNSAIVHKAPFWCSLSKGVSRYFLNDTSECYGPLGIDVEKSRASKLRPTLLRIGLPSGTHFLDVTYFDHTIQELYSQLILSPETVLDIKKTIRHDKYDEVWTVARIV